jgi:rhodanese-related sulfurtransferase
MIGLLKKIFGITSPPIQQYLDRDAVIVDVRNLDEYKIDHIGNSILIPLPDFRGRIEEVKDWKKPIIVYCRSGRRSGIATKLLTKNGIDAINGGGLEDMKKITK